MCVFAQADQEHHISKETFSDGTALLSPYYVPAGVTTVLSISLRKSFLIGALHRRIKFANICHDLMQNYLQ